MKKKNECPVKLLAHAIRWASSTAPGVEDDCTGEACAWYVVGFPEGCAVKVAAENLEGRRG